MANRMKRSLAAVVLSIVALSSSAQETTDRYVVGVGPARSAAVVAHTVVPMEVTGPEERGLQTFEHIGAFAVDLTPAEAATLAARPDVRFVEKDITLYALSGRRSFAPRIDARDRTIQTRPYGIDLVHAPDTWAATRGTGIHVAVIDTGIDTDHPDLLTQYAGGFNAFTQSDNPNDDHGHGTHVAGTIAATDNGMGVVGVAPNVMLWGVKVLNSEGNGSLSVIAAGMNWVAQQKTVMGGNWVVNMSLGVCANPTNPECVSTPPLSLQQAAQRLSDLGVLVFAATGNDSTTSAIEPVSYPAAFPTIVAVGAVSENQAIASFSNQGPQVSLVAPGVGVLSTVPVGTAADASLSVGPTTYDAFPLVGSGDGTVNKKFVYCGFGGTAGDFPSSVQGNVALIQRGSGITFNNKVKNALQAGAAGVVIYNCSTAENSTVCPNDSYGNWTLIGTLPDGSDNPDDLSFNWGVVIGVPKATGDLLRVNGDATLYLSSIPDDYAYFNGTSMASPHAAAAAALVWSLAPTATASEIRLALEQHARDLGAAGRDNTFGFGLVDAFAAAKALAPGRFGSGSTPPTTPVTGRRILRRGGA